jgi:hypothetical protein
VACSHDADAEANDPTPDEPSAHTLMRGRLAFSFSVIETIT